MEDKGSLHTQFKTFRIEQNEDVLLVTFDNPDKLNALTGEFLKEYHALLAEIAEDRTLKTVILTGNGKAFIAGADIELMSGMMSREAAAYADYIGKAYEQMEAMDQVFIAAINGYAFGGGLETALACDLRIASEKAKMGLPEVTLGIFPGGGGTQRLPRLIGMTKAKELIYTGRVMSAKEALEIGILNQISSPEKLIEEALELAERIGKNSASAVALAKRAMNYGSETDLRTAVKMDESLFGMCFSTPDQKEGMQAFLEKRKPLFN